jgi:hypothetical protein
MSKTTSAARVAGTIAVIAALGVVAGCGSNDSGKTASEPSSHSAKPSVKTPSLDRTWKFTTDRGCKGTIRQVSGDNDPLLLKLQNYVDRSLSVYKAKIDWRQASSDEDGDQVCSVGDSMTLINRKTGSKQEAVDVDDLTQQVMDEHDGSNDTDEYNKGVDIGNKFADKFDGAEPGTKGVSYAVFTGKVRPFTGMRLSPHGGVGGTVNAKVAD